MLRRFFKLPPFLPLLLLLLAICAVSSHGRTISLHAQAATGCLENTVTVVTDEEEANTSLPSCMALDEALGILESDDQLFLSPGLYTLNNFSTEVVREVTNISIIGEPTNPESVIISCSEDVGLFFFNVSDLTISGLTVEHCGIRGVDRINKIINMTREIVNLVYSPLPDFSAAMFLVHCPDLELSNVIIRDNRGFGFVGVNLIGSTNFHRVQVLQNYPSQCVLDLNQYGHIGGSGGGVFLVYQNYIGAWFSQFRRTSAELYFTESNVTDNFVCRLNLFHVLHDKLPRSISTPNSLNFSLIGAGGVTLAMAQSIFQASVYFESCIFRNNSGTYNGAAMHISQFELSDDSHVFIERTVFEDNGQELITQYGNKGIGPTGALHIWFYTPNPSDYNNIRLARRLLSQQPSSVVISRSDFTRNVARSGAGICVVSFGPEVGVIQDFLVLNDTTLKFNQADFGGAIYLTELSYSGFELGLRVHLNNFNVSRNHFSAENFIQSESGIIDVNFLNISVTGNNYVGYNNDTALSLYSAIATLSGTVLFEFNVGSTGGAIDLSSESYLVLTGHTNITFYRNVALIAGGAIHVNFDFTRFNSYDCFVFYNDPDFFCNLFNRCGYELVYSNFINNSAPLGGTIYGSTFTNCPWGGGEFDSTSMPRDRIIRGFLSFEPYLTIRPDISGSERNIINTLPSVISQKEEGLEFVVMPGKKLEVDLGAFDQLDQSVPLTVFSQLMMVEGDHSSESRALIGATNRYLLDGQTDNFTTVPIQVYGLEDSSYNLIITSNDALVEFSLNVTLRNCSLGFIFSNESHSCECQIQNVIDHVTCENDGSVTFPIGPWIGYIEGHGFASQSCIFNYCFDDITQIFLDDPDSQCRDNRAGVLCGRCREGYSRVLGDSSCRSCGNNNLSLILVFALLGILLVVMVSIFNITITHGYINGMIFYCNVISLYLNVSVLPPKVVNAVASQFVINLVNLNFGIDACFYDGMTALHLAILNLLFPFYLGLILIVITLISKYCHNRHFAKLLSKVNITHVFATLLLLTYTRIIRNSLDILSYITIGVPGGTLRVWRIDPNQLYLQGLHIFEFIIAVFLMFVLLPFPLLLLFPRISLRLPYVSRLKPLIDAFVAPLADGRRFWVGFRILSRNILFLLILLEEEPRNVTICTFIILITVLEAYIKPFRTPCRNLVDLLVMVNLTIFSFLVVVTQSGPPIASTAINFAFILLVFCSSSIFILLIFYVVVALPCTNSIRKKLESYFKETIKPRLLWFKSSDDENSATKAAEMQVKRRRSSYNFSEDATHTSFVVIPDGSRDQNFRTATFVGYRESIFEHSQVQ